MTIKLGLASVLPSRTGSVNLPKEIKLSCPQCGMPAADEGQCLVEMRALADPSSKKTGLIARMLVDCRACGCSDKEPAIRDRDAPSEEDVPPVRRESFLDL